MSSLDADKLKVFTGRANRCWRSASATYLADPAGRGRTELFPDGELIVKVDEDVRGATASSSSHTSHP
jgi:phosphoribosylpyrophosphate synthetase